MLKNYSKFKVDENGNKRYLNDEGKYHRLDGPAVEYPDRTKYWFVNGNTHRNIDPSDEYSAKEKYWFFNNKHHRVGGSYYSLAKLWLLYGKQYSKQEYFNKIWSI